MLYNNFVLDLNIFFDIYIFFFEVLEELVYKFNFKFY